MNLLSLIPALLILTATATVIAEPSPNSNDFGSLPLDEAERRINSTSYGDLQAAFAQEALRSKRIDLVQLCFRKQNTVPFIVDAIKELPDSPYKNQVVLMMLRTPSPAYWPTEALVGSRGAVFLDEPFISALIKYLPDLELRRDTLATQQRRLKIASDLEKAMIAYPEGAPKKVTPNARAAASVAASTPSTGVPAMSGDNTPILPSDNASLKKESGTTTPKSFLTSFRYGWILLAILILFVCAFVMRGKKG